jgi:two-component system OmpR family response regulator
MRILLVEDDKMIGEAMQSALKDMAYAVDWVVDGDTALLSLSCQPYDVVLLDLGLPKIDGLQVMQQIRVVYQDIAVIIITARDSLDDKIKGLDFGADDYLSKPFNIAELLARIRAVSRRNSHQPNPELTNHIIWLNPATHEARTATQCNILLSNREFSLLHTLLQRPGSIHSKSNLEDSIYGWGEEVESNAVEFIIHCLRKKLGSDTIKNVRGVGWMVSKIVNITR